MEKRKETNDSFVKEKVISGPDKKDVRKTNKEEKIKEKVP